MNTTNTKAKIFFLIASLMTLLQTSITFMPLPPGASSNINVWLGPSFMFLAAIFTLLQQHFSINIDNKAKNMTWVILSLGIIGAINDYFKAIPIDEYVGQVIRFIVTILTQGIAMFSKIWYPSEYLKQRINSESEQL